MEAVALRRTWVYSIIAVFVGLLLVLAPLVTIIGVRAEDHQEQRAALFSENLRTSKGSGSQASDSTTPEVESLALSFAIALFAFVFFRRRRPQSEPKLWGQWLY